jgi:hypothetical protein
MTKLRLLATTYIFFNNIVWDAVVLMVEYVPL